jgi:hypothetical protein
MELKRVDGREPGEAAYRPSMRRALPLLLAAAVLSGCGGSGKSQKVCGFDNLSLDKGRALQRTIVVTHNNPEPLAINDRLYVVTRVSLASGDHVLVVTRADDGDLAATVDGRPAVLSGSGYD